MYQIFSFFGIHCNGCAWCDGSLSLQDRPFPVVMREAYAKGWVTTCKSQYDGGDGKVRAYCPECASNHKENRFKYESI